MNLERRPINYNFSHHDEIHENSEWELAELVDAIAAEVEQAQNTLALKSYLRGMSFAVKEMSFDIEVKARRDADGKFWFRTINPDESSKTVLKLDFSQVLQSQIADVLPSLDDDYPNSRVNSLEFLPGITSDEIDELQIFGITSQDDLSRYFRDSQRMAELSGKTGIKECRLRQWMGLPFISVVYPNHGLPGDTITIEGGNFGNPSVFQEELRSFIIHFQNKKWEISSPLGTKLTVHIPSDIQGAGFILVEVPGESGSNSQFSNPYPWRLTKTLTIADTRTIHNLDPLLNATLGSADVMSLLFRGLACIDPQDGVRKPDLAREWKIEPSREVPKIFRVYLHDDIYFHNGDLLTAEDVVFTYQKILESDRYPWHQLAKCTIEKVFINDRENAIDFVLQPRINRQALTGLTLLLTLGIVPKDAYRKDSQYFSQHPIGCGPFQLTTFVPGQSIELEAFSNYRSSQGKPEKTNLDIINIQIGKSEQDLLWMLDTSYPKILNFPYSTQLEDKLKPWKNYYAFSEVEAADPVLSSVLGFPPLLSSPHLLVVQSNCLVGRPPNKLNPNWNAHLWDLKNSSNFTDPG